MARGRGTRLVLAVLAAATALPAAIQVSSHAAPRRDELRAAEQRLQELERDFELVVEDYNLVSERLDDLQVQIAATRVDVGRIERRMNVKQEAADAAATELYMSGTTTGVEAILGADTLADAETRLLYLQRSEDTHLNAFESLGITRSELDRKIAELEEQEERARAAQDRLNALRTEIEDKLADQKDEIAELNAEIEAAQRRREARAEAARQAALEAAREAAREQAAAEAAQQASEENSGGAGGSSTPPPPSASGAPAAVQAALSQVGKPYVWGASGPDSYDCSGLTMWAWAQAGVSLPHNSGMQYAATPRVDRSDWQPGDLLFFGSPIHHVAMYIGNGQMVEAPYTGSQVRVVSAFRSDYVGAGRPG